MAYTSRDFDSIELSARVMDDSWKSSDYSVR